MSFRVVDFHVNVNFRDVEFVSTFWDGNGFNLPYRTAGNNDGAGEQYRGQLQCH